MTPTVTHIWLAVQAVDMRLGIDGLSLCVQQALGCAPCNGRAYAFTLQRRQEQAKPKLDALHVWLPATRTKVAPGSGMAKAIV